MSYIIGLAIISVIIYLFYFAGVKENHADNVKDMFDERDKKKHQDDQDDQMNN